MARQVHRIGVWFVVLGFLLLASGEARADEQVASLESSAAYPVTKVLVLKGERRMLLLNGDFVQRSFEVELGRNPVGAKQHQGDGRTPEGEYVIDWRKRDSQYYRALHISYPNSRDSETARQLGRPTGGMIMIHGQPSQYKVQYLKIDADWTQGCIAVSNAAMDELWSVVADGTPIEIRP